jgi:BED zinc finger
MSNSSSRHFPVTVTQLPVVRCEICRRTVAYRPGTVTETLTEHYRRAHPEALGLPAQ